LGVLQDLVCDVAEGTGKTRVSRGADAAASMGRRAEGRDLIPNLSMPEDSNTHKANGPLESSTDRTSGSRIPELDGLRSIAIGLVLLYHFFDFHPGPNHHPSGIARNVFIYFARFNDLGWTGVDFFFILSGFLIGGILLDHCASPHYFQTFYLRRFFRIAPIYYISILAYFVVMAVAGSFLTAQFSNPSITVHYQVFSLFLFLQNYWFFHYPPIALGWFGPTWSLAVEEQFYLIAPLTMQLLSRRVLYVMLGATVCLAPLLRTWVHYNLHALGSLHLILGYTMTPCRAYALAIGICAALLWRNTTFRQKLAYHKDGQPSCLIHQDGVASRAWQGSYCLYLIHPAVGFMCQRLLVVEIGQVRAWQGIACNAVAAIFSYTIARLSWTSLEYPLLQKGACGQVLEFGGASS
jgi:peptidoglycan/LPS O-acetylase OafA/YrhL